MFSTSMTRGDFVTFFIRARNSVLMLFKQIHHVRLQHIGRCVMEALVMLTSESAASPLEGGV